MFQVFLSDKSRKSLENLDKTTALRIRRILLFLGEEPVPSKEFDVNKLEGEIDIYRIRIGNFRIIYKINWHDKEVLVAKIERRDEKTYR